MLHLYNIEGVKGVRKNVSENIPEQCLSDKFDTDNNRCDRNGPSHSYHHHL
jgi:hypothetical protein